MSETDPFAGIESTTAPTSIPTVKPVPASVVAHAQASLDSQERKQATLPTRELAEAFKAHLTNAGRHTSPKSTVRPSLSDDVKDLTVYWRAFVRKTQKNA